MRKLFLLIALVLIGLSSRSQHEADYWYFGYNAGMHFVGGVPVAITDGAMYTWEGCSVLSDHSGNLMFYTDGRKVWNRQHQIMPNGNGLLGDSSSTQSGMIVELPAGNKVYYLFTVDELGGPDGLRYSVIDMNLDSGRGDITLKNVALHSPVCEKISALFDSNNRDWVLVHEWNSNAFYAYKITPFGVDTVPVISNIGTIHSGGSPADYNSIGYMKFSPNGTKIALTVLGTGYIELFDFNHVNGVVSNPVLFPSTYGWAYGVEFSPDNSKLYITQVLTPHTLYQFNLNAGSPTAIINSGVVISQSNSIIYRGLQLGPDNKIYLSRQDQGYLGVINDPNNLGTACNYVDQGFYLGGKIAQYGLPNFMPSYFNGSVSVEQVSGADDKIEIFPNPANDVITIDFKTKHTSPVIIDIYNMMGQKMNSFTISESNNNMTHKNIPVNEFAKSAGCYFVKISFDNKYVVKKVVVE